MRPGRGAKGSQRAGQHRDVVAGCGTRRHSAERGKAPERPCGDLTAGRGRICPPRVRPATITNTSRPQRQRLPRSPSRRERSCSQRPQWPRDAGHLANVRDRVVANTDRASHVQNPPPSDQTGTARLMAAWPRWSVQLRVASQRPPRPSLLRSAWAVYRPSEPAIKRTKFDTRSHGAPPTAHVLAGHGLPDLRHQVGEFGGRTLRQPSSPGISTVGICCSNQATTRPFLRPHYRDFAPWRAGRLATLPPVGRQSARAVAALRLAADPHAQIGRHR